MGFMLSIPTAKTEAFRGRAGAEAPRGARYGERTFAPQSCIRLDPREIQTHEAADALRQRGSETADPFSVRQAMRLLGRRHHGSILALPRDYMRAGGARPSHD